MWFTDTPRVGTGTRFSRTVSDALDTAAQITERSLNAVEFGAMWSHGLHSGGV